MSFKSPNRVRMLGALAALSTFVGAIILIARAAARDPWTWWGLAVSVPGAMAAFLAIGSFYEWMVHRFLYHGPSSLPVWRDIYDIHERGHHWRRFPPRRYVHDGPVERIPVLPPDSSAVCGSEGRRWVAWWAQFVLYLAVGIPLAFLPAWWLTHNALFTVTVVATGLAVCYLFIRVHDVMHYPAGRAMERRAWFLFLDRHHYLHHIDNRVNLNFLLPLCDLLFGTLQRFPTEEQSRHWPSFEEAKRMPQRPEVGQASIATGT